MGLPWLVFIIFFFSLMQSMASGLTKGNLIGSSYYRSVLGNRLVRNMFFLYLLNSVFKYLSCAASRPSFGLGWCVLLELLYLLLMGFVFFTSLFSIFTGLCVAYISQRSS